jgi:hypothetical protein
MKLILTEEQYNSLLKENSEFSVEAYHGTRSIIPFERFDNSMIGSGLVSSGTKYNGFFFTTDKDNAEYYTEYFLCKVKINNVQENPTDTKIPKEVLNYSLENKQNYIIRDFLDGAYFSDIIVVPKNNLDTIHIIEWEFIGDEGFIFERWDKIFADEDGYVDQDMINETLEMMEIDINTLLQIPVFQKYYYK